MDPWVQILVKSKSKHNNFTQEKQFQNITDTMAVILSQAQCLDGQFPVSLWVQIFQFNNSLLSPHPPPPTPNKKVA